MQGMKASTQYKMAHKKDFGTYVNMSYSEIIIFVNIVMVDLETLFSTYIILYLEKLVVTLQKT